MIPLSYIFIIFFITLGPLKTIPAFAGLTRDMPAQALRSLAARSTLIATIIVLVIALVIRGMLEKWRVSVEALLLAGGILLLISSIQGVLQVSRAGTGAGHSPEGGDSDAGRPATQATGQMPPPNALAVTPLAVPVIVTPIGMVAILAFMNTSVGNTGLTLKILGLLLVVMALNWLGMFFARPFIRIVGATTMQVIGWIFAVLQAALAVEIILIALSRLGVIPVRVHV